MMLLAKEIPVAPRRPRGRPKLEDVALIESRLLDVALQEFLAHGYGGTSLTRIVKAAGISKTTLYARYGSKDALFRAIVNRQIEGLSAAAALRSTGPKLREGLNAYGNRTLEISLAGELREVNRLTYSESARFPELGAAAAERTEQGITDVATFIAECAEVDGIPCRAPREVATVFVFMLRGWYGNVLLAARPVTVRERQRWVTTAVDTLLAGRAQW